DAEQRRVEAAGVGEETRIRVGPALGAELGRNRVDPIFRYRYAAEPQRMRERIVALRVSARHATLVAEVDPPPRPVRVDAGEARVERARRRAAGQHDRVFAARGDALSGAQRDRG